MSYVTSYGGGETAASLGYALKKAGNVVPLWRIAGRFLKDPGYNVKSAATLAVIGCAVVGTLLLLAMAAGLSSWFGKNWNSGMSSQWLGVRHPDEIRLSDSSMMGSTAGRLDKRDTFFSGNASGPEFVEQPNYVLGNENMMRTALSKYNRLKMSGAAMSTWPVFWSAYKADNSDDLGSSMYDFGDDNAKSGFDPKRLQNSGIGR